MPSPQGQHKPTIAGDTTSDSPLIGSDGTLHFSGPRRTTVVTLQTIGKGSCGWVEEVKLQATGTIYAKKVITVSPLVSRRLVHLRVQQEIDVLRRLTHPHVIRLVGAYPEPRCFCILLEPVADCDLAAYYTQCEEEDFSERAIEPVRQWFSCLSAGIEYIHSCRIRHKDIKPQNILVKNGHVLFADFGLAKDFNNEEGITSTTEGETLKTPMYAAPEVHAESQRSYSADIFSLGCVFAEMATLLMPRSIKSFFNHRASTADNLTTHAFHATLDLIETWLAEDTLGLRDLILMALSVDPNKRPNAKDLWASIEKLDGKRLRSCGHHQQPTDSTTFSGEQMRDAHLGTSNKGKHKGQSISPREALIGSKNALLIAINDILSLISMDGQEYVDQSYRMAWASTLQAIANDFSLHNTLDTEEHMRGTMELHIRSTKVLDECANDAQHEQLRRKIRMMSAFYKDRVDELFVYYHASLLVEPPSVKQRLETESGDRFQNSQSDLEQSVHRHLNTSDKADKVLPNSDTMTGASLPGSEGKHSEASTTSGEWLARQELEKFRFQNMAREIKWQPPPSLRSHTIAVLGDANVGKSALIFQFCKNQFLDTYEPTIEDSYRKYTYANGGKCILDIRDTSGDPMMRELRDQSIAVADACILVYSLSSLESLKSLSGLYHDILRIKTGKDKSTKTPLAVVVGCKADLMLEREVNQSDLKALSDLPTPQFEVSAKAATETSAPFDYVTRSLREEAK